MHLYKTFAWYTVVHEAHAEALVSVSVAEDLMLQPEEKLHLSDIGSKHFLIHGSQQAKL